MDKNLVKARKAVEAAGAKFMAAFSAAYPAGNSVRWLHNGHEQVGIILGTSDDFGHNTTSPTMAVRNSRTGRTVRISLYDIEQAEGYDRFDEQPENGRDGE